MSLCPSLQQLSSYLHGNLSLDDLSTVKSHLQTCHVCESRLESLKSHPHADACQEDVSRKDDHGVAPPAGPVGPADASFAQLGPYALLEKLGQGGMGTVFKARHRKLDRIEAVKILLRQSLWEPQAVERFEREMRAVAKLDHPHIVRAHHAGEEQGQQYLVMEYVDGRDIGSLLKEFGRLTISDACEIVRQAAAGLQHVHEHGLVHRDIKPSNLIVSSKGIVKILDLGLALIESESEAQESDLTRTGQVMGTPKYMAPEQEHDSHLVDIRADLYSLGATLYHLLTGVPPFGGPRRTHDLRQRIPQSSDQPSPIGDLRDDVPASLAVVVHRLLAKDPAERFTTPSELEVALRKFTKGHNLCLLVSRPIIRPDQRAVSARESTLLVPASPVVSPGPVREQTPAASKNLLSAVSRFLRDVSADVSLEPRSSLWRQRIAPVLLGLVACAIFGGLAYWVWKGRSTGVVTTTASSVPETVAAPTLSHGAITRQQSPPETQPAVRSSFELSSIHPEVIDGQVHAFRASTGWIMGVAVSPDSRMLATSGSGGVVQLWDMQTGTPLRRLGRISKDYWHIEFSPEGERILASQSVGPINFWGTKAGEPLFELQGVPLGAPTARFTTDGRRLISAHDDSTVRMWNLDTHQEVHRLHGNQPTWSSASWMPDDRRIVTISADRRVRIWDTEGGSDRIVGQSSHPGVVTEIRVLPDGHRAVTSCLDGLIRLWNLETGAIERVFRGHLAGVFQVAVSPNGELLASTSGDGSLRIWSVLDGEQLRCYRSDEFTTGLESVVFCRDGRHVVTGGKDSVARLWRLSIGAPPSSIQRAAIQSSLTILNDRVQAPEFSMTERLLHDDFTIPSGWKALFAVEPNTPRATYEHGHYVIRPTRANWRVSQHPLTFDHDFACEVVGRVQQGTSGGWGLVLFRSLGGNSTKEIGFQVIVDGNLGEVRVEPIGAHADPWHAPQIGPIIHPAVRPISEYNRLLVVIRDQSLAIYMNGAAICEPIRLHDNPLPSKLQLGVFGANSEVRGEFDQVTIWSANRLAPSN
ncbi:MAG: hypothetical protein DWH91_01980 [Planctomycetota bacterium]|nr:MAG: hypothetical protein DWH91_01980 [Planctomycetota bacterium]